MVDLQRRVVDPEAVVQQPLELAAPGVAVVALGHEHVGGERREARRDLPDVQIVDLDDPAVCASARPTSSGSMPSGEPSSSTRPESRSRRQPERSISADDLSAAIPSASPEAGRDDDHAPAIAATEP